MEALLDYYAETVVVFFCVCGAGLGIVILYGLVHSLLPEKRR